MKPSQVIILLAQAGIKPVRLHYPPNDDDNQIWIGGRVCVFVSKVGSYASVGVMGASGLKLTKPRSMLLQSGRRALVRTAQEILGDEYERILSLPILP